MVGTMLAYIAVLAALFLLSLAEVRYPGRAKLLGIAAATIVALFAGLRYQTGYDWPAYEKFFNDTQPLGQLLCGPPAAVHLLVEPLYMWLNVIVKSLGGNSSWLFFIIAIFNTYALQFVLSRISKRQSAIWLVYFGIIFLLAQMAVLRQAIGSSFVLLGLLMAVQRRPWRGLVSVAVGAGFQVSTAFFAPFVFLGRFRPHPAFAAIVVAAGAAIAGLHINIFGEVVSIALRYAPTWIKAKLLYYQNVPIYPISIGALGLIAAHSVALIALYRLPNQDERRDPVVTIAIWLTLLLLAAHLYLFGFASVWNRVMLVTVPWELAAILRLDAVEGLGFRWRTGVVVVLLAFSGGSLVYQLAKPDYLPYKPYHSIIQVWLGDEGDGMARATLAIQKYALYKGVDVTSLRDALGSSDSSDSSGWNKWLPRRQAGRQEFFCRLFGA